MMEETKKKVTFLPDQYSRSRTCKTVSLDDDYDDAGTTCLDENTSKEDREADNPQDRRKQLTQMKPSSSKNEQQNTSEGEQAAIIIPREMLRHASNSTMCSDDDNATAPSFSLGDPLHNDTSVIGRWRNQVGAFINCRVCKWTLMGMIFVNAAILGALTFLYDNAEASRVLERIDLVFLVIFTFETTLQAFYLGPIRYLKNLWLLWDFIIITLSWAFLSVPSISVMRSFRIFRLFFLFSRAKSMRHLVEAVGRTLPKMASIWVALLLFFYTFCVLFTDLYHELYDEDYLDYDYFGRLDRTFLTLFQFMTLDSWSDVVRQVQEARPAALIGFCIWIIITAFFVMNLMVAVICESLIELNNMRDKKRQNKMLRHQRNLISAQTQELLEETHEVVKLQKELLANQVVMQKLLVQIATQMSRQDNHEISLNAKDSTSRGKGALSTLLSEISDTSDTERHLPCDEPPDLSLDEPPEVLNPEGMMFYTRPALQFSRK